jgi:hypothetical protein
MEQGIRVLRQEAGCDGGTDREAAAHKREWLGCACMTANIGRLVRGGECM